MKKLGLRFKDIDKIKTQSIQLDPKTAERLGFNNKAIQPIEYIKKYLNDSQMFDNVNQQFIDYVDKTLPIQVKQNCKWCLGEREDENNKKCNMYSREAEMNFFFASVEFVSIVERNRHLIKGEKTLKGLTIKFFECFAFNSGRVWFDLEKITMPCLKAGFMTLSQLFSQNSNLQNLSIISEAIQNIDDEQLDVVMFGKEPPIYLEPEKMFFENKQRQYEREHFIEKESKSHKKRDKQELSIYDFFPNVPPETVEAIQQEFKGLKVGKEIAILINLLDKEHSLVFIDDNAKQDKSRLHFVRAFTGKNLKKINGVNNFLQAITGELKVNEKDAAYIEISKRLEKIVSNG